ncbi:hypothetical protein [Paludisphaera sp.]|uniref:hypothetical protein n=1 Tax=Paludisphaera sp. TaxID=2017432 RepID=UPI00301CDEAE
MNRQRGSHSKRFRRLFSGGEPKAAPEHARGPHVEVPAHDPPPHHDGPFAGESLRATLDRWTRLDAPLPEALIRRGLVALRVDRATLGEAARAPEAGGRTTRIHESSHFAVDVLAWRSGEFGPILEQGDAARVLLVVEGTATEIDFADTPCGRLAPTLSRPVPAGTVSVSRLGDHRSIGNLQAPGEDLVAIVVTSPINPGRIRSLADTVFDGKDMPG